MKKALIVIAAVALIVGIYVWSTYNKLITVNEQATTQWAQVESQYQRRFDLIPNLVESVKGGMEQEKEVFGALAEARTRYAGAGSANAKAEAATEVESALGRLLVVMENYPQLKSSETVQTLMSQLESTENRISVERMRYNETAQSFNVMAKRIPAKWIAASLGFGAREYFEAAEGAETAPKVEFGNQ